MARGAPQTFSSCLAAALHYCEAYRHPEFLGKYSFPLYATHFPLRNVLGNWVADHPDVSAAENAAVVFAFVVAALALAYLCMQAIDALVRLLSPRKTA